MDVIDIAFAQIGQLFLNALDGTCKIVDVEHHAYQVVALIPAGIVFTAAVDGFQAFLTLDVELPDPLHKLKEHGTVVVKLHVEPAKFIVMFFQTEIKFSGIVGHFSSSFTSCGCVVVFFMIGL